MLWDLKELMFNLFICAQGQGSQVTGMYGIEPPSIEEYLFSANYDWYIDMPGLDNDGNNFDNYNEHLNGRAYYHGV